jgi:hypothetical protein
MRALSGAHGASPDAGIRQNQQECGQGDEKEESSDSERKARFGSMRDRILI